MTASDPAAAARAVAREAADTYQELFADRLVAAYLLGSLSYGGYSPAVSDIDLAVVLTETRGEDAGAMAETAGKIQGRSDLHRKLSVFWSSLPALRDGRDDGRFPALDRLQLADHGVLLLGEDVTGQVAAPPAEELVLDSANFALTVLATDEVLAEFHTPRRLLADRVWFTKAVLFPLRFLYSSARTAGRAARNTEAVEWYLSRPDAPGASLVRLAVRVRAGDPVEPEQATRELTTGLPLLYRQYIDDQTRRLREIDAPAELIEAFERWGTRLS